MTQGGKGETVYLTRERLIQLEHELHDMKTRGRRDMAQKIAEARSHGDLSENAEYDAAKEEQEHFEMRIGRLELTLARANIIDARDLPNDRIYILTRVKLLDLKTNDEFEYLLVSPEEADFDKDKISVTSPIGKSLLGREKGDSVEIKVPAGILKYKILDINR